MVKVGWLKSLCFCPAIEKYSCLPAGAILWRDFDGHCLQLMSRLSEHSSGPKAQYSVDSSGIGNPQPSQHLHGGKNALQPKESPPTPIIYLLVLNLINPYVIVKSMYKFVAMSGQQNTLEQYGLYNVGGIFFLSSMYICQKSDINFKLVTVTVTDQAHIFWKLSPQTGSFTDNR